MRINLKKSQDKEKIQLFQISVAFFIIFSFSLFFLISIKVTAQNIIINQTFNMSIMYNENSINLGGIESTNLLLNTKNENFLFNFSFYFMKYEFYYKTLLNYSFFINYIWLRIPLGSFLLDFGIKPEIDVDQVSIDLFAPYSRFVYQNYVSLSGSQNRFQISFKLFIADFSILNFKWYPDYKFDEESENIFLINLFNFFDPFQIEIFAIYYEFSDKTRFAFSIKFPFVFNWLLSSALHFNSNFEYRYYETKIQASYQFNKISILFFWYYTSYVFSIYDFISNLSDNNFLNNLDELLTMDNNLFGINLKITTDPFFSFNLYAIFTFSPVDILFSISAKPPLVFLVPCLSVFILAGGEQIYILKISQ